MSHPPEPVLDPDPRRAFGQLLGWLMCRASRPDGTPKTRWTPPILAKALKDPHDPEGRKVRQWLKKGSLPQSRAIAETVETAIFGNSTQDPWRGRLLDLWDAAKDRSRSNRTHDTLPPSVGTRRQVAESNLQMLLPEHFLGREDDLSALHASLQCKAGKVAVTAVHGMRGVGKSMLATAYARRHRSEFEATWWINAQTEAQIRQCIIDLGVKLKWIRRNIDAESALSRTLRALEITDLDILLIFDNALSADELRPFIPRAGKSKILVTSNNYAWAAIAHTLCIDVWPSAVGAKFLCQRSGRSASEHRNAALLAEALGGLPLALEQAGACCEQLELSFSAYKERFDASPISLLDDGRYPSAEYHLTVARTFAIAIEEASRRHGSAKTLMLHAALLSPEPIPCLLFSRDPASYQSQSAKDDFEQALAALRAFALVRRETIIDPWDQSTRFEAFRLHRLVRIVAAAQWPTDEDRTRAKSALILALADVYPSAGQIFSEHETWPLARALNDHVARFIEENSGLVVETPIITRSLVSLVSRFASYSQRAGVDKQTIHSLWERNLAFCQRALGDRDDATAEMHNNLAVCLNAIGEGHQRALVHYERAYLLRHNMRGHDGRTALCAGNMATLLHAGGKLALAAKYYEIAIEIAETCEPNTTFTSSILSKAAVLFAAYGDTNRAQRLIDRAEVAIRRHRPVSIEMAELLKNQAIVSSLKDDRNGQLSAQRDCLRMFEKVLTPTNWLVVGARNDLCHACIANQQYLEALRLARAPIRLYEQGHPCDKSIVYAYNAVAKICALKGKLRWAERFYGRALGVLNTLVLGPDEDKAQILTNLAHTHLTQAKFAEAIRLFRQTLSMRRICYGSPSEAVANTLADLGFAYDKLERTARATWLHKLSVLTFEQSLGFDHQRTRDGRAFLENRWARKKKNVVTGKLNPATTYTVTYVLPRATPVRQSTS